MPLLCNCLHFPRRLPLVKVRHKSTHTGRWADGWKREVGGLMAKGLMIGGLPEGAWMAKGLMAWSRRLEVSGFRFED